MAQSDREIAAEIKLKDELKTCKIKIQMLKDGIKKERVEREGIRTENKELKDKNKALQIQQKKKDEKYEQLLSQIRQLKNLLLIQRNEKEKVLGQVNLLNSQIKQQQNGETPGGWTGYLGGFLKR